MVELHGVQWTAFVHYQTFKKLIQNAIQFWINQNAQRRAGFCLTEKEVQHPFFFYPWTWKHFEINILKLSTYNIGTYLEFLLLLTKDLLVGVLLVIINDSFNVCIFS